MSRDARSATQVGRPRLVPLRIPVWSDSEVTGSHRSWGGECERQVSPGRDGSFVFCCGDCVYGPGGNFCCCAVVSADLHLSASQMGMIFSAFYLTLLAVQPGGRLCDRPFRREADL